MLLDQVKEGLARRFAAARGARDFRPGDVAAGRAFVAAYVPLAHWAEGVARAAEAKGDEEAEAHHGAEPARVDEAGAGAAGGGGAAGGWLPWILSGVLGTALLVESAFLARRRGHRRIPRVSTGARTG
jgi:hypothetical protein